MIPTELRTARLLLRPWRAADAAQLHPILAANQSHLHGWIAAHVSALAPVDVLAERLARFAGDFSAGREFRFAVFDAMDARLLGEADLFVRDERGRVPLGHGESVELGYWLDATATGRGIATEATTALIAVAERLPMIRQLEIRCDVRNVRSAAIPARLGFSVVAAPMTELQVWRRPVPRAPHHASTVT